jgi:DNA/RNA endonuclease G (NUC1)
MKKLIIGIGLSSILSAQILLINKLNNQRVFDTDFKLTIYSQFVIFKKSMGSKKRLGWHTDKLINPKYQSYLTKCYRNSGTDKGHLEADRFVDNNHSLLLQSYEYTNAVPEYPYINRVVIRKIESKIHETANRDGNVTVSIWIIPSNKRLHNLSYCPVIPSRIIYKWNNNLIEINNTKRK